MNKLGTALRLIRLLNERKALDSRIVATELNVSLRTAQRYLLELSSLPCVIAYEKEHIYALSPDYHLKDALLHDHTPEQALHAFLP
jgi:predicted DNA-binding transcriptional regulator YafY